MQPTRRVIFYTSSMLVPEAVTQFDSISINDSTICICLCNQHNSAFLSSIRQRMILTMFPILKVSIIISLVHVLKTENICSASCRTILFDKSGSF